MTQNIADITLTPAETLLASRIQFDPQVLRVVKGMIGRDVEPYAKYSIDSDGWDGIVTADEETSGRGLTVKIDENYAETDWHLGELDSLREILPAGYMAFLTEDNCYRSDLTILKTIDPYDILRVRDTYGWDFQHKLCKSEDLIGVLVEWQKECRLKTVGADYNNVKLIMETLPDNLVAFAEKVNFLCWELDQINGFGCYGEGEAENCVLAEKLAAHLRETRRLYLWWD